MLISSKLLSKSRRENKKNHLSKKCISKFHLKAKKTSKNAKPLIFIQNFLPSELWSFGKKGSSYIAIMAEKWSEFPQHAEPTRGENQKRIYMDYPIFFCKIFFLKITAREKISSSFLPKQNLNENFKHYDCPKIAKMLPLGTYFVPFFRSPKIHPNPKEETKATNIGSYAD